MMAAYRVEAAACIRCGSSATVAPALFRIEAASAEMRRQPASQPEEALAAAARTLCPTAAISGPPSGAPLPLPDDGARLCDALAVTAERARWRWDDLPWERPRQATPGLPALVREIAFSELATFAASRRFLHEFGDDVDFSGWIAVWLYEEARHPRSLIAWLDGALPDFSDGEIERGRLTAPFPKTRLLTLATNVLSEQVATARYLAMSRGTADPLLSAIARHIAADEARHGASFFLYARRALAALPVDDGRRQVLTMLRFWLDDGGQVVHPVQLLGERAAGRTEVQAAAAALPIPRPALERRLIAIVGHLLALPLADRADVAATLRTLATRREAMGA